MMQAKLPNKEKERKKNRNIVHDQLLALQQNFRPGINCMNLFSNFYDEKSEKSDPGTAFQ